MGHCAPWRPWQSADEKKTPSWVFDHTGAIVAHARTDATGDDTTTGVELIETVDDDSASVTADTGYDTGGCYEERPVHGARPSWSRRRPRSSARDQHNHHGEEPRTASGGSRRHATISTRESRTPASGIRRSSAMVFEPGHPAVLRTVEALARVHYGECDARQEPPSVLRRRSMTTPVVGTVACPFRFVPQRRIVTCAEA